MPAVAGSPYCNLDGLGLTKCKLTIPYYGTWTADITLQLPNQLPTGTTVLAIGTLSLVGNIVRMASFAGVRSARLVGGNGGWRKMLPAAAYASPVGVQLSQVLGDAANAAGEKVNVGTDRNLGMAWVREAAPASETLRLLSNGLWWMDAKGVTQLAPRASGAVKSSFQLITYSGGLGKFTIATEDPAAFQPGASFTAPTLSTPQTIGSVTHYVENDGVARIEVMGAA